MTYKDAAAELGVSTDAITKRASGVRDKLGGYWNREWGDPPDDPEYEFVSTVMEDRYTYCWIPPDFAKGRRTRGLQTGNKKPDDIDFMSPPPPRKREADDTEPLKTPKKPWVRPEIQEIGETTSAYFGAPPEVEEEDVDPGVEPEGNETPEEAEIRFEEEAKRIQMSMKYDTELGAGFFNRGKYYYVQPRDGSEDYYVFSLKQNDLPFIISGEKYRQMWRRYTSKKVTIDMLCLEFSIDRKRFVQIKNLVALTKTQPPFTHEEFATMPRDEIERQWAAHRKSEIAVDVEKKVYRDMKDAAGKWFAFEKHNREVHSALKFAAPLLPRLRNTPETGDFEIIVGASDWHINKRPVGRTPTLEESTRFLYEMAPMITTQVLERHGTPARWNVIVGSDLTQSDSYDLKTTRGTPQGAQCIGSHAAAEREAIRVLAHLIDVLHSVAPVRMVQLPGNHDRNTTSSIFNALEQRYNGIPSIEAFRVAGDEETQHPLFFIGDWPCYGTHGDSIKKRDMPNAALSKSLRRGATKPPIVFHGHWHNEGVYFDFRSGVWRISLPSLSVTDDWHEHMGFDSVPMGCAVVRVNRTSGLDGLTIIRGNPS